MFEKQFHLVGWIEDLDGELQEADFAESIAKFAYYLGQAGEAYKDSASGTERRRELAFLVHLAAKLSTHLAAKVVKETPD